jgi:valyl-tRNA synthetase
MKKRLQDWVNSLAWDWPISRQRYFATPIPLWECTNSECGKVYLAEEEGCYVDPTIAPMPVDKCEDCGAEVKGCQDVLDTWMDSSISPLFNTYWERDPLLFKKLYPMSMRPQAQDIIRTWAYYTILREWLLVKEKPWNEVMIGAYILSPDGTPMHASKGNTVNPIELLEEYGSDSVRYWAAMCGLGDDSPVNFKELTRGSRLGTKLYNVQQLIFKGLGDYKPEGGGATHILDRWILGKYSQTVESATKYLDNYEFDKAVKEIEYFVWHELADHYLEMVKQRMYAGDDSAMFTLYTIGLGTVKLLAVFMPHITEELYQQFYREREEAKSVHISGWPEPIKADASAVKAEVVKDVIAAIRNWKSEKGMALNAEVKGIKIAAAGEGASALQECSDTIKETMKIKDLSFIERSELAQRTVELKPVFKNIGPHFKADAKELTQNLKAMDPGTVDTLPVGTTVAGKEIKLGQEYVELKKGYVFHGEAVETLAVGEVLVVF